MNLSSLRESISRRFGSKNIGLLVVIVAALAVPLTVFVALQRQEFRQRAAGPVATPPFPPAFPQPVAYWQFNESSVDGNSVSELVNSYTTTIEGTAIGPGITSGRARIFTKSNDKIYTNPLSLNLNDSTVVAWVFPNNGITSWNVIASQWTNSSNAWNLSYSPDFKLHFHAKGSNCVTSLGYGNGKTILDPTKATWYFVAATRNATTGTVQLYVNGQLDSSFQTSPGPLCNTPLQVMFGVAAWDPPERLVGGMDEVGIWNTVLTQDQLGKIYQEGLKPTGNIPSLFMPQGTPTPIPVQAGPIDLWHMDETNGTTVVDSVKGLNGTATGTTIVPGKINNARQFTNPQDQITTTPVSLGLNDMSVGAWIYPSSSGERWNLIVSQWSSSIAEWNFSYSPNYQLHYHAYVLSGGSCVDAGSGTDSQPFTPNTWHYVTATRNASTGQTKLYVDGKQDTTFNTTPGPICNSSVSIIFGRFPFDPTQRMVGKLDEVSIWNRILTDQEIQNLFKGR